MSWRAFFGALLLMVVSCASSPTTQHGTHSTLTTSAHSLELCEHKVPGETCTRCHPELVQKFKAANDWCVEHDVPESQCLLCHPELTFEPLPTLPASADVSKLSSAGEDVGPLEDKVVQGKVTVFDFYADWCAPCRKIDAHLHGLLQTRDDIAIRKLNVVSWETPIAKRHLTRVETLPHLVVFDKRGRQTKVISGLDLEALDRAIAEASAP